ncbi:TolC family protein [Legionella oakridgensis]|uniref:TolC family protein n=1 Tax=Legionella oakridgensis TaxID=29423 RepID=UPI0003DE04DB|nr:outer membrane protein [Legionella oakridgensis RV-2-2007]
MIKQAFLIFMVIISLQGCNVHHAVPPVRIPEHFPSSTETYKHIDNLPYVRWWQQFDDPQLNRLMECGLRNNMDIHIALGNLQQARGELQQVKLSWIPMLKLFGGYSTNPALGVPGGFYGMWPYYTLNIAKQISLQNQAKWNVDYYRAAMDGTRLTLIGQIASAYFTLMAQKEQLRLLKQLDADVKELIVLSRKDIQIGLQNEIDLASVLVDERLIAAQMKPIEHNLVVSENALRYLINDNPGKIKSKNNFTHLDFSRIKPGSLPATVLNNRPDLKMARYAVKRSQAGIWSAYSDFFPALQLDDFLGEAHLPNSTFEQATDAYFQGVLDPATFGRIATHKGTYHADIANYIKTVRRILKEVDNDFSANKRFNELYAENLAAEKDYRHKYELQKGLLKAGLISYKVLLESKIYLDNLALSTNQAKLQLAMSMVMLYQDLAGGYKC